jgi:hypothetical protein
MASPSDFPCRWLIYGGHPYERCGQPAFRCWASDRGLPFALCKSHDDLASLLMGMYSEVSAAEYSVLLVHSS